MEKVQIRDKHPGSATLVCGSGIGIRIRGGKGYPLKGAKYHDLIVFNQLDVLFWG
jgi:hypothetical protein